MSDRQLPPNPSLDHLKNLARDLQRAAANGEEIALARVGQRLPGYPRRLSLAKAQTVVAREYGFPSWPKLKAFVEAARPRGLLPEALNDSQAAFVHAVVTDDVDVARQLLSEHPDLVHLRIAGDSNRLAGMVYDDGWKAVGAEDGRSITPLHHAAFGHERMVALLLASGAPVDALGYDNNHGMCTALMIAAWEGTIDCVCLLLEAGGDPNAMTSQGGDAAEHRHVARCREQDQALARPWRRAKPACGRGTWIGGPGARHSRG